MGECDGLTATGPCDNQPKYRIVRGSRNHAVTVLACGVHLAQQVKRQIKGTNGVEVYEVNDR